MTRAARRRSSPSVPQRLPRLPTLPATLLRDAIGRHLATISLRQAATEIGLSPNALKNFLAGAEPRATTRAKLERWLAGRKNAVHRPAVGDLVRLLGDLTAELSAAQTATIGRETTRLLLAAYQERRLAPPRWVRELAAHYRTSRTL